MVFKYYLGGWVFLYFLAAYCNASEIKIPANIKVLQVNDRQYSASIFDRSSTHALNIGHNRLHLQFKELVEDVENDDHTTIYSKPFVVLLTLESSKHLTLLVPTFEHEKQVRAYAKKPTIAVVDEKQAHVEFSLSHLNSFQVQQGAKQVLNDKQNTLHTLNVEQTIPDDNQKQTDHIIQYSDSVHYSNDNMPLEMLRYWWQKASNRQKSEFISQLNLASEKGK